MELSIFKEFSDAPGLRYCNLSEKSGEEFYHSLLNSRFAEAIDNNEKLVLILDYTEGFAPSFLDESIGNLVYDFSLETVERYLIIVSNEEPFWIDRIKVFCEKWEERRLKQDCPKVTIEHSAWVRIIKGKKDIRVWEHPVVA